MPSSSSSSSGSDTIALVVVANTTPTPTPKGTLHDRFLGSWISSYWNRFCDTQAHGSAVELKALQVPLAQELRVTAQKEQARLRATHLAEFDTEVKRPW